MTAAEKIAPDEIEKVIAEVSNGLSLTEALEKQGLKSSTFFNWLQQVPSLDEKYARAKENHADILVAKIKTLAESDDNPQKVRNAIDAYKWIASKFKSRDYSDRIDVNVNATVDIRGALDEARSRIRDVLDISKPQLVETTETIESRAVGCKPAEDKGTAQNELDDLLE